MKLIVLTSSAVKKEAVHASCINSLFDEIVFVKNTSYESSDTIEQPVGFGGKIICKRRIETYMKNNYFDEDDYILAIENYIDSDDNSHYDIPICILYHKNTYEEQHGTRANYPDTLHNQYMNTNPNSGCDDSHTFLGYTNITIGEIFHSNYPDYPSDNWIKYYNDFDRVTQIKNGLNKFTFKNILKNYIVTYPDFPKNGIMFEDVMPLLYKNDTIKLFHQSVKNYFGNSLDNFVVVGLESRGFIIGMMIATIFKLPFVPIRKEGKLPGLTYRSMYEKEYGTDVFQIQQNAIEKNKNILVVDDIVATGGSLKAGLDLVQMFNPKCVKFFVLNKIDSLTEKCKSVMINNYDDIIVFFD